MIYCVEDDDSIRELMVYTLQASGFEEDISGKEKDKKNYTVPAAISELSEDCNELRT